MSRWDDMINRIPDNAWRLFFAGCVGATTYAILAWVF